MFLPATSSNLDLYGQMIGVWPGILAAMIDEIRDYLPQEWTIRPTSGKGLWISPCALIFHVKTETGGIREPIQVTFEIDHQPSDDDTFGCLVKIIVMPPEISNRCL